MIRGTSYGRVCVCGRQAGGAGHVLMTAACKGARGYQCGVGEGDAGKGRAPCSYPATSDSSSGAVAVRGSERGPSRFDAFEARSVSAGGLAPVGGYIIPRPLAGRLHMSPTNIASVRQTQERSLGKFGLSSVLGVASCCYERAAEGASIFDRVKDEDTVVPVRVSGCGELEKAQGRADGGNKKLTGTHRDWRGRALGGPAFSNI